MMSSGSIKRLARSVQRRIAVRTLPTYRTVSFNAVTILAGIPPVELLARMYSDVYRSMVELRGRGAVPTARTRRGVQARTRRTLMSQWSHYLANEAEDAGRRTVEVMAPVLSDWMV